MIDMKSKILSWFWPNPQDTLLIAWARIVLLMVVSYVFLTILGWAASSAGSFIAAAFIAPQ